MTEDRWVCCSEPSQMLKFLQASGWASERKFRLFAVACCRRLGPLLDRRGLEALDVYERYADGLASDYERGTAGDRCWATRAGTVVRAAAAKFPGSLAEVAPLAEAAAGGEAERIREREHQCGVVRDLFGLLPFCPVPIEKSWQSWSDGTVVKMAQAIYGERRFEDMPILADALEDAGCDNEDVLSHCRSAGKHGRGCWVVDLLLGRE